MSRPVIAYSVSYGQPGYMPDSHWGAFAVERRGDLAELVRDALESYDMPAYLFKEVRIQRLWKFVKRHGASTAHFYLDHKGYRLTFSGLTQAELDEASINGDT